MNYISDTTTKINKKVQKTCQQIKLPVFFYLSLDLVRLLLSLLLERRFRSRDRERFLSRLRRRSRDPRRRSRSLERSRKKSLKVNWKQLRQNISSIQNTVAGPINRCPYLRFFFGKMSVNFG